MKKIIFTLALISVCGASLHAQKGYEGSIDIGHSIGIGKVNNSMTSLNFINGYRFNPYFFAGVGMGIGYVNLLRTFINLTYIIHDDDENIIAYSKGTKSIRNETYFVPVFINLKTNITKGRVSPFLSLNVGSSFLLGKKNGTTTAPGFMTQPNIGVDIRLDEKRTMFFLVGLIFNPLDYFNEDITCKATIKNGTAILTSMHSLMYSKSGTLKSIDFRVGLKF